MSITAFTASSIPPPTSPSQPTKPTIKNQFKPPLLSPTTSLSLLTLLSTSTPSEAKAFTVAKDQILTSLTKVEDAIDQVEHVGSDVFGFAQSVGKILIDTLKPGVDAALPVLKTAGEEALKVASPAFTEASKQAKEALESAGVDPTSVGTAAKTIADAAQQTTKVIEGAKPIASATVETLSTSDPSVIVVSVGAIFLAYLIVPPIWSAVSFNLRGYKGSLSPAQTLDLISTQNHFLIDIRPEKDKSKAGIPRLPSSAKNKLISIPLEDLPSKLKGLVRNAKQVEAEIVALKISYLKRVNKGSNIVIMDLYSDSAKIVARTLTTLGFKNCWIMSGGFSGNKGWLQSRLGTESYNVTLAEVISPSRVIPATIGRFGSTSSAALQSTRKFLPRGIDD
ncbi:hypothetical protein QJS04_geneDACA013309 [Acorus gramineus]|uniref:Rhodanese domain-containing protein n=1 Tax=Acorus gramineus TaxID=55184 RepID=A0AAV9BD94_ACOGR|nr:hypothetical protein QJS04_geneDACA013309 [Acorus gramineus]